MVGADAPPRDMRLALEESGLVDAGAVWRRLGGGRTNKCWAALRGDDVRVCKLSLSAAQTPLFPNDAQVEATVLRHLTNTELAPTFLGYLETCDGDCIVYRYVFGSEAALKAAAAMRALRRLHRLAPPTNLRRVAGSSRELLAEADAMLTFADEDGSERLRLLRPEDPGMRLGGMAFLHGDPVPGNVIRTPAGPVLIDWQCPAVGSPIHDIGMLLSPAMHVVNGARPPGPAEETQALAAYGDAEVAATYRTLAPILAWRMAAYCTWKAARGDRSYEAGLEAELRRLKRLRDQDQATHSGRT